MDSNNKNFAQERNDAWMNLVTALGTQKDKRMAAWNFWENRPPSEFEDLYASDELASRIVNVVPDEALRRWVEWTNIDPDVAEQVVQVTEELELRLVIERTWKWARAYGGAITYMVTNTAHPELPLQPGEKILALRDLSRYDLTVMPTDVETDFSKPNYGYPNYYRLNLSIGTNSKIFPIHHSRVIRFDGYLVPRRTFIRNNYWHDSILNRLINSIRNYQTANDSAASILQDFNVGVYKMKNLANMMAAGNEEAVKKRIEMLAFSKSNIRTMILDADSEEFADLSRSVDGLGELLTQQANRLVAATDIPHTKLLGESPDGSNATGNSTTSQWFDYVQAQQENYLRPKLKRVLDILFPNLKGLMGFKFKSLYQMTELEEADLRNKTAQTDQIYLSTGVLDPSEVAESRFGGESYSIETELDEEARAAGLIGPGSDQPDPFNQDPNAPDLSPDPGNMGALGNQTPSNDAINIKFDSGVDTVGAYPLRNTQLSGVSNKRDAVVSSIMSQPYIMDPSFIPGKAPGAPNQPRTIEPQVGNGITAPSGSDAEPPTDQLLQAIREKIEKLNQQISL